MLELIAELVPQAIGMAANPLPLIVVFVLLSISKLRSRPRGSAEPKTPGWMQALDGMPPAKALGTGFLVTVINPKELIFGIAAGVVIGSATLPLGMVAAALLIYTAIATITVVVPVVAYLLVGARVPVRGMLEPVRTWLVRYYNVVIAVVLAIIGAVMIGKGLAGF